MVKRNGEDCIQVSDETFEYLSRHHEPILAPLTCSCAQRPYPHSLDAHRKIFEAPGGYWIWRGGADDEYLRFSEDDSPRWPWSLRWAMETEAA